MKKNLLGIFCGLALCLNLGYGQQVPGNPKLNLNSISSLQVEKAPSKLSPELKKLSDQNNGPKIQSLSIQLKPVSTTDGLDKYVQYHGNGVVVDVTVNGSMNNAKSELQKSGLRITGVYGRVISGIMPLSALSKLESLGSIQYARPAFKPVRPIRTNKSTNTTKTGRRIGNHAGD